MQFILGIALLLVFVFLLKNFFQSAPQQKAKSLLTFALVLAGLFILMMVLTGRLHVLAALGAAALLLLRRLPTIISALPTLRSLLGMASQARAQSSGPQVSTLDTSLARMTLDHNSGQMDGEVLVGEYEGRFLSQMRVEELARLYRLAVQNHTDALEVLETYFERVYGVHWRTQFGLDESEQTSSSTETGSGALSLSEARDILGVDETATEQEIIEAHRRLMQQFHPDRGGSNYFAARLNEAKAMLLNAL